MKIIIFIKIEKCGYAKSRFRCRLDFLQKYDLKLELENRHSTSSSIFILGEGIKMQTHSDRRNTTHTCKKNIFMSGCSWTKCGKIFDAGRITSHVLNSGVTEPNLTEISHKVEIWWPIKALKSEFQYSNSYSNASKTNGQLLSHCDGCGGTVICVQWLWCCHRTLTTGTVITTTTELMVILTTFISVAVYTIVTTFVIISSTLTKVGMLIGSRDHGTRKNYPNPGFKLPESYPKIFKGQ